MASLIKKRLPASSLIEVTVAAALLVLVFAIALGVLARLELHGPSSAQLRAQQIVRRIAATTIRQQDWQPRSFEEGGFSIEQEVHAYHQLPDLLEIRVTASSHERSVAIFRQLLYVPAHEKF